MTFTRAYSSSPLCSPTRASVSRGSARPEPASRRRFVTCRRRSSRRPSRPAVRRIRKRRFPIRCHGSIQATTPWPRCSRTTATRPGTSASGTSDRSRIRRWNMVSTSMFRTIPGRDRPAAMWRPGSSKTSTTTRRSRPAYRRSHGRRGRRLHGEAQGRAVLSELLDVQCSRAVRRQARADRQVPQDGRSRRIRNAAQPMRP